MAMNIISETAKNDIGNSPNLEILIGALEATDCDFASLPPAAGDEEYARLYDQHWSLRATINSVPARNISELKAKARAAKIELDRGAHDCDGPGSFVELSRSLIADLMEMKWDGKGLVLRVVGAGQ